MIGTQAQPEAERGCGPSWTLHVEEKRGIRTHECPAMPFAHYALPETF